MAKILIGWIAISNDFLVGPEGYKINQKGPTWQFHQYFFDHDKHILLYSQDKYAALAERFRTNLNRHFSSHNIETRLLAINDPIDFSEVKPKTESLLLDLRDHQIDIFFSPGTSIMQLSWFICHTSLGLNTRLLQTRSESITGTGKPSIHIMEIEKSTVPYTAFIRESNLEKKSLDTALIEDFKITDSIKPVYELALKIAQADKVTTLILGESGSGKEHLARFIHDHSMRKDKPFLTLNCSAFSDPLLESRLFGFVRGAFTGAERDSKGLFLEADKGTVFLDEIGDISPYMQQSLLRFIQSKEIHPVGGTPGKTDVRIIAATNRNLEELCLEGKFRYDLFYRLNVAVLELPSLRERGPEEVDELFEYFLDLKQIEMGRGARLSPTREVINHVKNYSFPGNIRQLENLVESLYVYCDTEIHLKDLPVWMNEKKTDSRLILLLDDVEKEHISKVLLLMKNNKSQTARALGISLNTLKSKMAKYGIGSEMT